MDKLKMQSVDNVQMNIEKIQQLFPNAVTEVKRNGKVTLAVDFDVLKQELSSELIDDKEERYQMTWPDKKKSILLANSPVNKTLRPCKEESVDFDNTQNLYIEGDNLDALKLLQETYLGKIKMIYIDPPYNTGNDFVYNDDFAMDSAEYADKSGQYDEQGDRLVQNTESNGRFHTDWLNMIYPRLKVAKDLLSDDGVIFISIDDNEYDNLKKICDEIFGTNNFISNMIWQNTGGSNTGSNIVTITEYVLIYGKNKNLVKIKLIEKNDENYKLKDEFFETRGRYYLQKLDGKFTPDHYTESLNYPIYVEGKEIWPGGGNFKSNELWNWRWSKTKVEWGIKNKFIEFIQKGDEISVKFKNYEFVDNQGNKRIPSVPPKNVIGSSISSTATGTAELYEIFRNDYFPFPKSSKLLSYLLKLIDFDNGIVLDFFSGSATTAHAVMQLNAEDGGNRKFIMVQLPEKCDEKSEAYKAGYKTICDIGKERIRRAGKKIKEENPSVTNLDIGFRVLKLDSSNMKDIYYKPSDYSQNLLDSFENNIKEDRTPLDLLFQVMLDLGKPLSAKIEEKRIAGKQVFIADDNDLIACFDKDVTEETVTAIAKLKPLYAVLRDSGLSSDSVGANFDQIFATYSPNTTRKVL